MEHVVIRRLEHLTGNARAPQLGYAVETRDRPGPAHKHGAFPHDAVWVQLRGGLMIARARIELCWIGEYSHIGEVRNRTRGSSLYDLTPFWAGRPKYGYAAVASLRNESWLEPFWAGPRTYGYEWVLLEDEKKRAGWLDKKPPPRSAEDLADSFARWKG
jgi:hypothetical protein